MLSFAWKWLGERKTYVLGLDDYNGYQADMQNDYSLTEDLWMLFDQADITVAHNGRAFDKGKARQDSFITIWNRPVQLRILILSS